jgi:hypothetical protein
MRTLALLTVLGSSSVVVASAAVALAASPPVASFGPVSAPDGTAIGSGTVGSGGETDACVNDQHSGANPSASDANGAAQLNDRACQPAALSGGSAQTAGTGTAGSPSGSQASGGRATSSSATGTSGSSKARTTTVLATQAFGLRIASIRFATRGIKATRRLGVLVTVRDRSGFLVRDAIVSIAGVPGTRSPIAWTQAAYSNRLGQATFRLPLELRMGGKRLLVAITARTPKVQAYRVAAVHLPALTAAKA